MFREKNLSCGIVGGYGPVEIATGGDAFSVSRREMISMFVAGKTLGYYVESAAGFFPGGCRPWSSLFSQASRTGHIPARS